MPIMDPTRLPPDPIPEVVFTPGAWPPHGATPVPTLPVPVGGGEMLPVTGISGDVVLVAVFVGILIGMGLMMAITELVRFGYLLRYWKAMRKVREDEA